MYRGSCFWIGWHLAGPAFAWPGISLARHLASPARHLPGSAFDWFDMAGQLAGVDEGSASQAVAFRGIHEGSALKG